ncbi:MAG: helix-turn-helix domain-containing protein [Solirubrobacteraceae bacterium]|jgi:DNA-binding MarR family transcriptional regulator
MSTTPEVDNTPLSADDVPIPALLRAARGGYTHAVRARLAAAGFEDLPRNGAYILGGIVNRGGTAGDLVRQLGVSKQAASQLIDTLVVRGYLDREVNPEDRRRVTVLVTERGRAAAAAVGAGVEAIDEELATLISPGELAALRGGLIALCDIGDRLEEAARAGVDITDEY